MTLPSPDPVKAKVIEEYEYWASRCEAGEVSHFHIEVRPYQPLPKRVTSNGMRGGGRVKE